MTMTCVLCSTPFEGTNANMVPSVRINGRKEPVCEPCITGKINPARRELGIPEIPIPAGVYA